MLYAQASKIHGVTLDKQVVLAPISQISRATSIDYHAGKWFATLITFLLMFVTVSGVCLHTTTVKSVLKVTSKDS